MLRMIAKLLKVLNSETEPSQISLAFCFAMIAGFTPLVSLHNIIVLLLILVFPVNLSGFLLGLIVFYGIAYALGPVFHRVGLALLTSEPLNGFWTFLYNSTLWRLEKFNNSIVMGSLIVSLIFFIPLFFISNVLIRRYREHVLEWVRTSRIAQVVKASKFYRIYNSLSEWRTG